MSNVDSALPVGSAQVGVFVVSYADLDETRELVRSWDELIKGSSLDPDAWSVHIWDNAGHHLRLATDSNRLRYTSSTKNVGFGRAMNEMANETPCAFIFLLNPDIRLRLTDLEACIAAISELGPQEHWCPQLLNRDGSPQTASGQLFKRSALQEILESFGRMTHPRPDSTEYFRGAALGMPKDLFLRVGGFDDRFFLYGEDVDLGIKLRAMGSLGLFDDSVSLIHEGSVGLYGKSDFSAGHFLAAKVILTQKYSGRTAGALVAMSVRLGLLARVAKGRMTLGRRAKMLEQYKVAMQSWRITRLGGQ